MAGIGVAVAMVFVLAWSMDRQFADIGAANKSRLCGPAI